MRPSTFSAMCVALLALTLTGCDALFELFAPDEHPPAPQPPDAIESFTVDLDYEDTTDVAFYIFPHASIVAARWLDEADCDLSTGACDPNRPLLPIQLDLINDGNADLTRVIGHAFVYNRDDQLITRLTWQRDAFQEKDGEVNVWQMRETVSVEITLQDLCVDITRDACDAENYTPRNVSRVYIDLEIVGVSPL